MYHLFEQISDIAVRKNSQTKPRFMSAREIPQKTPVVIEVEAGTYNWCSCGKSTNQPYCDGSHSGTEFRPVKEVVSEKKIVAWCGCKHTGGAPFCDGSHSKL